MHPSKEELSGFMLGKLSPEIAETVGKHLDECPPCQETVVHLEGRHDTFVARLGAVPPPPVDPKAKQAIERVKALAKQPMSPDSGAQPPSLPSLSSAPPSIALPPGAVGPSREQFIENLLRSKLLDRDEWRAVENRPAIAAAADGATLAKALVADGALTKFQAAALYQGKLKGLVFGDYLVLDLLGAGGMGQVYRARHRRMDRIVALKVLAKAAMKSPDAVKRFQREVKAAAKLVHPNIVIAHDAGEQDGVHYLVMEYVAGSDLSALLKANGPLPIADVLSYLTQAARGLAFAHQKGIVHRDIKPGNLLVDAEGTVRILDMGLARFDDGPGAALTAPQGELTQTGAVMGTVDYMAPEQALDTSRADAKADVYALGCTLYRLLTGLIVYGGDTLTKKILAHREEPIPSLRADRPDASPALDALFQRLVAKRPEDRPTAAELVTELETIAKASSSVEPNGSDRTVVHHSLTPTESFPPSVQLDAARKAPKRQLREPGSPATGGSSGKKLPIAILTTAGAGALFLLLGVWVIIRDKDGNETARALLPDGGDVKIVAVPSATKPIALLPTSPVPPPSAPVGVPPSGGSAASGNPEPAKAGTPTVGTLPQPAVAPFDAKQARAHQEAWAKHLGTTVETTNSVGMKFVVIPPGEGVLRKPPDYVVKMPRKVDLPYRIGATEVTQAQYQKITGINPSVFTESGGNAPVENVTWKDANEFCRRLSALPEEKQAGRSYRLPTIDEWGCACQAGSDDRYCFGADETLLGEYAWYRDNSGDKTHPVATKRPNAWGLFDMHGGVEELLSKNWSTTASYAIGSWKFDAAACVTATPYVVLHDHKSSVIGFRVVCDVAVLPIPLKSDTSPPPAVAPFDANQARAHQEAWAKHLGTTVETTNSVGAKMVLIPPGEFLMGSTDEQVEAAIQASVGNFGGEDSKMWIQRAERPQHRVVLTRPFQMSATEATIGEFKKFAVATGYRTEIERKAENASPPLSNPEQPPGAATKPTTFYLHPGHDVTDDFPAQFLSWNDAAAFCEWLSGQEHAVYRLPTEAEWEYACRAGTTTQYSFGDDAALLDQYGWHRVNSGPPNRVATKGPNPFGLFDMHGNVYEWCRDYFNDKWYDRTPTHDPTGPETGAQRVIRGGWAHLATTSRSAYRSPLMAGWIYHLSGFRVVREISPSTGTKADAIPGADPKSTQ